MIRWPGFLPGRRADEGELFDPCDVIWIRAMQVRAGIFFLVWFDQHALALGLFEQPGVLFFGAVAPKNIFRLSQTRDFLDPI